MTDIPDGAAGAKAIFVPRIEQQQSQARKQLGSWLANTGPT